MNSPSPRPPALIDIPNVRYVELVSFHNPYSGEIF